MKKQDLTGLKKQLALFSSEVLLSEQYQHLGITTALIDKPDETYRIVVIAQDKSNVQLQKLVKKYFKNHLVKVIEREGQPKGTANMHTGGVIRHVRSSEWGTYGGLFSRQGDPGQLYGLSNSHVLGNYNTGKTGDKIKYGSNLNAGTLFNYTEIKPYPEVNHADAALFAVNPDHETLWVPDQPKGYYQGLKLNLSVYKQGAATDFTEGYVSGFNGAPIAIEMGGNYFWFENYFCILGYHGPFNAKGDSGSLVLTANGYIVGIVFAEWLGYCYALHWSTFAGLLQ